MMKHTDDFKCARCGNCCKWHGFVRLSDDEIDRIAAFMKMDVNDFLDKYTILTPDRRSLSLTERTNGECIFYDAAKSLCMIQAVKPQQCINFPQLWNFSGWENECEGAKKMKTSLDFKTKVLGSIIVLSGPSGVGKSTIIKKVRERMSNLRFSVSCTTRPMRKGEVADVDYHFLSKEEFVRRREAGEFIESAEVFANCYGTLKSEVMSIAEKGENVVLDIDVQGALQIMEKAKNDPMLAKEVEFIFIVPPSMEELERRLRSRATDSEEQISLRLGKAAHELSFWQKYEWLIVNDDADIAAEHLYQLIKNFSCAVKKR